MNSVTSQRWHRVSAHLVAGLALLASPSASAVDWNNLQPVSDDRLASLRGGFEFAPGLNMSFGIERAVFINGELITTSRLNISGVGNVSASSAPSSTRLVPTSALLQSGNSLILNNGGQAVQLPGTTGLITGVQNSLNNQLIQVRTTIDANLSSLTQLRTQMFAESFRQSTIDAVRR